MVVAVVVVGGRSCGSLVLGEGSCGRLVVRERSSLLLGERSCHRGMVGVRPCAGIVLDFSRATSVSPYRGLRRKCGSERVKKDVCAHPFRTPRHLLPRDPPPPARHGTWWCHGALPAGGPAGEATAVRRMFLWYPVS